MDERALQQQLATLERRQSLIVGLLMGLYLLGSLVLVVIEIPAITVWHAVVAGVLLGVAGSLAGIAHRRRSR